MRTRLGRALRRIADRLDPPRTSVRWMDEETVELSRFGVPLARVIVAPGAVHIDRTSNA